MQIVITLEGLLSLTTGGILLLLSVVALFAGSLPDNGAPPAGDAMRWIVWPLFLLWVLARILR